MKVGQDPLADVDPQTIEEGYPNRMTYLRLIGATRSGLAYDYLSALVAERLVDFEDGTLERREHLLWAIEALGNTANPRVAAEALATYERFDSPDLRRRVVRALDYVESVHGLPPDQIGELQSKRDELSLRIQTSPSMDAIRAKEEQGVQRHMD